MADKELKIQASIEGAEEVQQAVAGISESVSEAGSAAVETSGNTSALEKELLKLAKATGLVDSDTINLVKTLGSLKGISVESIAAIGSSVLAWGPYILAIGAVIAIIKALISAHEQEAEAIKKTAEAARKAAEDRLKQEQDLAKFSLKEGGLTPKQFESAKQTSEIIKTETAIQDDSFTNRVAFMIEKSRELGNVIEKETIPLLAQMLYTDPNAQKILDDSKTKGYDPTPSLKQMIENKKQQLDQQLESSLVTKRLLEPVKELDLKAIGVDYNPSSADVFGKNDPIKAIDNDLKKIKPDMFTVINVNGTWNQGPNATRNSSGYVE